MKFSELMETVRERGVTVSEMRGDATVAGVAEDSRRVKAGDVFVARAGTKVKGAEFVADALRRGAAAVVSETVLDLPAGVALAQVTDANLACALLAHEMAGNPTGQMKMIGITGTKGKTTVAYLLRSVLQAAGFKVGMIGTVEIDDGEKVVPADMTTPGSVELVALFCRMRANGVTHCVMEVSSHALHQHRVAGIDFAVGIFTNLTGDHLDYHKTMEAYAAAKAMLFEGLSSDAVAVVNGDDAWVDRMVAGCRTKVVRVSVVEGFEHGGLKVAPRKVNGWSGLITRLASDGMTVNLSGPDEDWRSDGLKYMYRMNTPLVGRHNAYNLISVVAAAHGLGMPDAAFMKGIRALETAAGAPGRLQRVVGGHAEFSVFVDYAHTHDALENVLRAVRATMGECLHPSGARGMLSGIAGPTGNERESANAAEHGTRLSAGRLICVFGCGGDRDRTKRPKMARVAEQLADWVIVTSDNPRTEDARAITDEICAGFSEGWLEKGNILVMPDRRQAIRAAIALAEARDVVLIAGKGHENYQIIGTTKHHFDDVEEAQNALRELQNKQESTKTRSS